MSRQAEARKQSRELISGEPKGASVAKLRARLRAELGAKATKAKMTDRGTRVRHFVHIVAFLTLPQP